MSTFAGPLNVIYEDNHVLVAEKPQNIPSQADDSRDADMLTLVKAYIKEKYQKPGNVFAGLVHRLDRPAGGLMLFARTSKAASRLSEQVRTRNFHKEYLAVVIGRPQPAEARLTGFLVKDTGTNIVRLCDASHPEAKDATLEYKTLATADGYSLVGVNLVTGRPHQIRVQMAGIGHPLAGDVKYGGEAESAAASKKPAKLALWSAKMSFTHPVSGETLEFTLRPPNEFPWNLPEFSKLSE